MRAIRAIREFLKTVFLGTWRVVKSILQHMSALVAGLFRPPTEALKRLLVSIRGWLGRAVQALLAAWARIFQRAPKVPIDPRPTPGRAILLMIGSGAAVAFWYLAPWPNWLELSEGQFQLAIYGSAVGVALLLRAIIRSDVEGAVARFFERIASRVGLIWFERFTWGASVAGLILFWNDPALRPLMLLAAVSFLILLATPNTPRRLLDDLPLVPDLITELEDGSYATHSFEWDVTWGGVNDRFSIRVEVDTERFLQMQSMNPIAPADLTLPDFSPWIVAGATGEVDQSASAIRRISNDLGYTSLQESAAVLAFAQSMDYTLDAETTDHPEYWRYPIETIHEETGDCEDTTILAAAVLRRLGHEVLPLLTPGHAALGIAAPTEVEGVFVVYEGRRYYYCETTSEGWRVGQLPPDINADSITVSPLREPSPRGPG